MDILENRERVKPRPCRALLLDFGGVVAEEGYAAGLRAIATRSGLDPEVFYDKATELIYDLGYVLGKAPESAWWRVLREDLGVRGSEEELREEILGRFVIRPWMLDLVAGLRQKEVLVAILSDQTNWLDELDGRNHFFEQFDRVWNSYHLGRSKREAELFKDVPAWLGIEPSRITFVDDHAGHVGRAGAAGLMAIHYTSREAFERELAELCRLAA